MTIEKISAGFIVAMMLGTALATPPAHAASPVVFEKDGVTQSTVEDFVMFAKDSTPEQPKCLHVQRWVSSIGTYADDQGNISSIPMIKQADQNTSCTADAKPYEDVWQARQRMFPVKQTPVTLK